MDPAREASNVPGILLMVSGILNLLYSIIYTVWTAVSLVLSGGLAITSRAQGEPCRGRARHLVGRRLVLCCVGRTRGGAGGRPAVYGFFGCRRPFGEA